MYIVGSKKLRCPATVTGILFDFGVLDMRKRIASILLCMVIVLGITAGCSEDNNAEIVGKWVPSTVSLGGTTVSYSDIAKEDKEFSMTFESSGNCVIVLGGIRNEGTFVFNETSVDVTYGSQSMKLNYSQGILTLTLNYNNESTSYMFTKVQEE